MPDFVLQVSGFFSVPISVRNIYKKWGRYISPRSSKITLRRIFVWISIIFGRFINFHSAPHDWNWNKRARLFPVLEVKTSVENLMLVYFFLLQIRTQQQTLLHKRRKPSRINFGRNGIVRRRNFWRRDLMIPEVWELFQFLQRTAKKRRRGDCKGLHQKHLNFL